MDIDKPIELCIENSLTISQLIKILEEIKDRCGDLHIMHDQGANREFSIFVNVENDSIVVIS